MTAELFGNPEVAADVLSGLWDDEGNARCLGLDKLKLDRELANVTTEIRPEILDPVGLDECTLSKIELEPNVAGYFSIKFRVQGHPTPEEVGALYEIQGRDVELILTQKQRDMFDDGASEAEQQEEAENADA